MHFFVSTDVDAFHIGHGSLSYIGLFGDERLFRNSILDASQQYRNGLLGTDPRRRFSARHLTPFYDELVVRRGNIDRVSGSPGLAATVLTLGKERLNIEKQRVSAGEAMMEKESSRRTLRATSPSCTKSSTSSGGP